MKAIIDIESLTWAYPKQPVFNDFSFQLRAGEFCALAGANGAGKSTLIQLILGLLVPANTPIHLFGEAAGQARSRQQLCYLPERFQLRRAITGWAYLQFIAGIYSVPDWRAKAETLAQRLLLPVADLKRSVTSYSKGMMQKLGLVGIFLPERPLLILDEPLSGLDPVARFHFKTLLQEKKAEGLSLFYATHLLADADEICDRLLILDQGRLRFDGSPAECRKTFAAKTLEQAYIQAVQA